VGVKVIGDRRGRNGGRKESGVKGVKRGGGF